MNPGSRDQRGLREAWATAGWLPGGGGLLSWFYTEGSGEASRLGSEVGHPQRSSTSQSLGSTTWKWLVITTLLLPLLMEGSPQAFDRSRRAPLRCPKALHIHTAPAVPSDPASCCWPPTSAFYTGASSVRLPGAAPQTCNHNPHRVALR